MYSPIRKASSFEDGLIVKDGLAEGTTTGQIRSGLLFSEKAGGEIDIILMSKML